MISSLNKIFYLINLRGVIMADMNAQQQREAQDRRVKQNLEKIKNIVVVMSGKGGVGKSTVATNLAFSLSQHGYEVGIMDVDINGPDIAKMLGIEDERMSPVSGGIAPVLVPPHLKVVSMAFLIKDKDTPVIWRGPLKMSAIKQFIGDVQWGDLDYLIIDLPPGTGDEPLSIAQLIPSGYALIVTTPQDVALLDSRKAVNFAKTLKMPILGILENMSGLKCPHCSKEIELFKTGGGSKAASDLKVPFLGSIPIDPKIVETGDSGQPFVIKYSKSESAKEFSEVIQKIEKFVNNKKK
jgi:Mrp family chromosome partitioning ATPase